MNTKSTLALARLAPKLVIDLSKVSTLKKFNSDQYILKSFLRQVKLFLGFNITKFANNINKIL